MARPLRKTTRQGQTYKHPPSVVSNIDVAIGQNLFTLKNRLQGTDRESPDYLTSECLVHLIRDAQRREDHEASGVLVPVLLSRCEAILKSKIDRARYRNAEKLREDILGEFA